MSERKLNDAMKAAQFKKGQVGNKFGRKKLTPKEKQTNLELRNLTIESYRELLQCVISANMPELKKIVSDPQTNVLTVAIGMSLLVAVRKGDYGVVDKILQRLIGKIPDQLNIMSDSIVTHTIDVMKLRVAMKQLEEDV